MGHYAIVMAERYREWLIKIGGGIDRGAQTRAAEETGLAQSQISKIINGQARGKVRIDTLERIAEHMDAPTWRVVWAIETGSLLGPHPDQYYYHGRKSQ